jgi:hypothetical protein
MAYRTITHRCATIVQDEIICSGTPSPGHLMEIYNNGGVKTVRVHSLDSGDAMPMFCVEDELQGKDVADAYVAATICPVRTFRSGDLAVARVQTAQTLVFGTKLESGGDGTLQAMDVEVPSYLSESSWIASAEEVKVTLGTELVLVRIR